MTAEVVPVCQDVGHDSACVDDDSNFQALKNAFGESANDANSSLKEMKQCGEKIPKKKEQNNHVPHHHHRRKPSKKKRKWKPYSKMTWEVRLRLEMSLIRLKGLHLINLVYFASKFVACIFLIAKQEDCRHTKNQAMVMK